MKRPPPLRLGNPTGRFEIALLGLLSLVCLAAACNSSGLRTDPYAVLAEMVVEHAVSAVPSTARVGQLECWLTLQFNHYPEDLDPRDVRVRFYSDMLMQPAEFDWRFIAENDRIPGGTEPNPATTPESPPPLSRPVRVRFPLPVRLPLVHTGTTPWLQAELYWGGEVQGFARNNVAWPQALSGSQLAFD